MTNRERRQLLDRFRASGMEGSILDVYQAYGQGRDLIAEHYEQQQQQEPVVLTTPQEQQQGLRPYHAAGDMNRSAVFKDVPPHTPFNTHGMSRPINIEKYDEQGHLVESHKSIPPGISDIPTGPHRGDVIETPAEGYRDGGFVRKMQDGGELEEKSGMTPEEYSKAYNEAVEKYGEDVALAFDPQTGTFGVGNQMLPTAEVSARFEPKTKEERDAYNNLGVAGALQMRDMQRGVTGARNKFAEDYMVPAADAVMMATGVGDAAALGRGAFLLGRAGLKGLGKFAAKQAAKRTRPVPSQKDLDKYVDSGKYMMDQLKGTKTGAKIKTGVADEVINVKHGTRAGDLTADKIKLIDDVPTLGARPGKARRNARKKTPLEGPGGFYTARGNEGAFFGTDRLPHQIGLTIPKGSKYVDLSQTGMKTDVMAKGDLQKFYQDGYDYIIGRNIVVAEEILPLNPEILKSFKYNYLRGGVRRRKRK